MALAVLCNVAATSADGRLAMYSPELVDTVSSARWNAAGDGLLLLNNLALDESLLSILAKNEGVLSAALIQLGEGR